MTIRSFISKRLLVPPRGRWLAILGSIFWLGIVTTGMAMLWKFENVPGYRPGVPAIWPQESGISHEPAVATLIMFIHPYCPCTRASIGELNTLLSHYSGNVKVRVLCYKPHDKPDKWAYTDSWQSAAAIPGVQVSCDQDGAEARRFGAETSGFIVLYDGKGQLTFNGGITSERGHAGDNNGRSAIAAILNNESPQLMETPVFGCSISNRPAVGSLQESILCKK